MSGPFPRATQAPGVRLAHVFSVYILARRVHTTSELYVSLGVAAAGVLVGCILLDLQPLRFGPCRRWRLLLRSPRCRLAPAITLAG